MIKTSFKTQFYWNKKCANVVQTIKRKRRKWIETHSKNRWRNYLHALNIKKKFITKKKKLKFKKIFEILTDQTRTLWRFARWACMKSHQLKEILKISNLMQPDANKYIIKIFKLFTFLLYVHLNSKKKIRKSVKIEFKSKRKNVHKKDSKKSNSK